LTSVLLRCAAQVFEDVQFAGSVAGSRQQLRDQCGRAAVVGVEDEPLAWGEMAKKLFDGTMDEGDESSLRSRPAKARTGERKGGDLWKDTELSRR
jgi:hypothetical protein